MRINEQLKKRVLSWLWRAAMMGVAVVVSSLIENISGLGLDPFYTTALGLVLGEVSKYINGVLKK